MAHNCDSSVDPRVESHNRNHSPQRKSPLIDEQVAELSVAFSKLNINGSGTDPARKMESLVPSLGKNPSAEKVDQATMDEKEKLIMNCEHFLDIMSRQMTESNFQEVLQDAFNTFDVDGDGIIGAFELQSVMRNLGDHLTEEQVQEMLEMADVDGDGKLSYDDFMSFATSLLTEHKVFSPQ